MDLPTLPETELIDPDEAEILASFRALPTEDDLPCDDGEPMETPRHREQMNLLIDSLKVHWAEDVSEVLVCYALWVSESLSILHPHRVTS